MTRILEAIARWLEEIEAADLRLQERFQNFRVRYFTFLRRPSSLSYRATPRLRIRLSKAPDGRVRRITWTRTLLPVRGAHGRTRFFVRELPGNFRREWVYFIQKDWARVEGYTAFGREARELNSMRSQLVGARKRVRQTLERKWVPRSGAEDAARAEDLFFAGKSIARRDILTLKGAVAFAREVSRIENEIGRLIEEWGGTFAGKVAFCPAIRENPNGTIRIYWGFPNRVYTSRGRRTFTEYTPRPTDRWMRSVKISTPHRLEVRAFMRKLAPLEQAYESHRRYFGRMNSFVLRALSRVEKLFESNRDRRCV